MLTYKAMYKFLDEGVHGEVLDFPGTITFAENLEKARRSLASAIVDMAETNLINGESLPIPNPQLTDSEADIEEPIHLILTPASRVQILPDVAAS
jgi:predicted RNase H-like HicB family nuclease